jgi:hypothetical protein
VFLLVLGGKHSPVRSGGSYLPNIPVTTPNSIQLDIIFNTIEPRVQVERKFIVSKCLTSFSVHILIYGVKIVFEKLLYINYTLNTKTIQVEIIRALWVATKILSWP